MSDLIRSVPWDSDFFGLRIGRVDIENPEDWSHLEKTLARGIPYELVYVFDGISGESPLNKEALVDIKVVYAKTLVGFSRKESPYIHFYEDSVPDDDLYALALISGQYSRYRIDSRFPSGCYERLYMRWIENSVNGQFADAVLYYAREKRKLGMITINLNSDKATIGLIAVDSSAQGKGIGTTLIQATEEWLMKRGVMYLEVATQNDNDLGCRFYEKCGFRRISETNIYHLWL